MSEPYLSDEVLMAFADGELDEPIGAAVCKPDGGRSQGREADRRLSAEPAAHAHHLFRRTRAGGPALLAAVSAQIEA